VAPLAVIDARAAARPELGGVERWARELADRLPRLRPGAYAVAWPPPRMAHRLGHLWEQTVLPARAARSGALLLCPANLAPLTGRRNVVVLHDGRQVETYSIVAQVQRVHPRDRVSVFWGIVVNFSDRERRDVDGTESSLQLVELVGPDDASD